MNSTTITGHQCETSIGNFFMMKQGDGKFHIIHDNKELGTGFYSSAEAALRDLVSENFTLPSSGVSAATLGIPDILIWWDPVLTRRDE